MLGHNLVIEAEYVIEQALPTMVGVVIAIIAYFLKTLISTTTGEQTTTRKEIRDLMVEYGALAKDVENLRRDVNNIGDITRTIRGMKNE